MSRLGPSRDGKSCHGQSTTYDDNYGTDAWFKEGGTISGSDGIRLCHQGGRTNSQARQEGHHDGSSGSIGGIWIRRFGRSPNP